MDPTQSNSPQQSSQTPQTDQVSLKPPKKSKKKLWIALGTVFVLILAGAAAYMILKKDKAESAPSSSSTTQSTTKNVQVGEYLEIPELDVRLKLPSEIKDAYYEMHPQFDTGREWANVSTKTLKDLDSGCSAAKDSISPGYVGYFTDPSEPYGIGDDSTISSYYPDNFRLGDKYVFYSTYNQSPCYNGEDFDTEKSKQIDSIFKSFEAVRIEGIDSPKTATTATDLTLPTSEDITEIKKTAESLCAEAGGYSGENINLAYLQGKSSIDGVRYYDGYALIGIGCKDENGGYMSFMQKQADGSYKQLFGAQDIPDCEKANQYKIPKQVLPSCTTNQGQDETPNTN